MIDFGMKGWDHSFSEYNNREYLMTWKLNYHFADFEEIDKLCDWNFSVPSSKLIT